MKTLIQVEDEALEIVSYIGCGISIGFLSVSILFFLSLGYVNLSETYCKVYTSI